MNIMADTYYGEIESPLGGKFSISNASSLTLPDPSPETLIPIAARSLGYDLVKTNNYNNVRDTQYSLAGNKIIYFSSKRYVDWAGPETVASYAVEEGLSDGSASQDVALKVQQQVLLELDDILSWLKKLAQDELDEIISCILEGLFTQKLPLAQSPKLNIKSVPVIYTYTLEAGHGVEVLSEFLHLPENPLKPLLAELHVDAITHAVPALGNMITNGTSGVSVPVTHNAFVIEWLDPTNKSNWLSTLVDNFDQLAHQVATADVTSLLQTLGSASATAFQPYFAQLNYTSFLLNHIQDAVLSNLLTTLNLTGSVLQSLESSPPTEIIDLTNTQLAKNLAAWMKKHGLAIGNDANVTFESLTFDLTTYRIEASISLHHRNVWNLADIPTEYKDFLTKNHLL